MKGCPAIFAFGVNVCACSDKGINDGLTSIVGRIKNDSFSIVVSSLNICAGGDKGFYNGLISLAGCHM
jgi:hypothetical protein